MALPIIFSIDDDPQVLRAISRDLKSHYREKYRILSTTSVAEAMESLLELQNRGDEVAMFISDQRMPEMQGMDFLQKAMKMFPFAKRVLLTAYSDTEAASVNSAVGCHSMLSSVSRPTQRAPLPLPARSRCPGMS